MHKRIQTNEIFNEEKTVQTNPPPILIDQTDQTQEISLANIRIQTDSTEVDRRNHVIQTDEIPLTDAEIQTDEVTAVFV